MHTLLRRLYVAGALFTLIASPRPLVAQDSGPVTRPQSEPTLTDRLPAPKPSAYQRGDGRIVVSWPAIERAVSYRVWRSVPPAPTAAVTLPNPQQNSYEDADVQAGRTYYYLVAAVNEAGIEGLRGGTTPVTATISPNSTTMPPTVSASLTQQDPPRVYLSFSAPDAVRYEIRRIVNSSPTADPTQIQTSNSSPVPVGTSSSREWTDSSFQSQPYARQASYTVVAILANGAATPGAKADVIIPAATGTTTTGSTDPATSTGATSGTAPTVTAKLEQQDPYAVLVSFGVANGRNYDIERTMYRSPSADPSQIDYSKPVGTVQRTMANTSFTDSYLLGPASYARSVSYAVRANMWDGTVTPIGKSNVLILPASGSTTTLSTAITGGTTFTVATPATVKNGATTSLAASIGSPARWVSLNESVATVDASGTVTGRVAGSTRIVALAASSDGSLRVVAIPLTVSP